MPSRSSSTRQASTPSRTTWPWRRWNCARTASPSKRREESAAMAELPEAQRRSYPLPSYNFRVTIDGAVIGCSEVSGLSREYGTVTYRHGLSFLEGEELVRFSLSKFSQITLKKGVVIGTTSLLD